MSDQITVERTSGKWWRLIINGTRKNLPYFRTDKRGIEEYLKTHYNII